MISSKSETLWDYGVTIAGGRIMATSKLAVEGKVIEAIREALDREGLREWPPCVIRVEVYFHE